MENYLEFEKVSDNARQCTIPFPKPMFRERYFEVDVLYVHSKRNAILTKALLTSRVFHDPDDMMSLIRRLQSTPDNAEPRNLEKRVIDVHTAYYE